jgi:hypothetical protein
VPTASPSPGTAGRAATSTTVSWTPSRPASAATPPSWPGCGATVLDIWPTLWNFTEHPDAEATNNRAERALRHAVLWRKTSNGTQTDTGERFVKRILSIRETCRLNNQSLHGYLVEVHNARLTATPIPTPLPAAA